MAEQPVCEACKKNAAVGVACLPGVPMSVAYCCECLRNNIHPKELMRASVICCGGIEHTAPSLLDGINVLDNGMKMSVREYLTAKPLTDEELQVCA